MNPLFEANIIRTLAKIVDHGHLLKGYKPVHWCLDCASALAEAEVEYADKESSAIDVAFAASDSARLAGLFGVTEGPVSAVIWTTTPWTLPANQAICLNAELNYAWVSTEKGALILAEDLVESCMQRYGIGSFDILSTLPGSALEHCVFQHPLRAETYPSFSGIMSLPMREQAAFTLHPPMAKKIIKSD